MQKPGVLKTVVCTVCGSDIELCFRETASYIAAMDTAGAIHMVISSRSSSAEELLETGLWCYECGDFVSRNDVAMGTVDVVHQYGDTEEVM